MWRDLIDMLLRAGANADALKTVYSVAVPFLISAMLGWMFVPRVLLISRKKKLYDIPDARKVHNQPIPRLGGITFLPVLLMSFCLTIGIWMLMHLYGGIAQANILIARFILLGVGLMILYLTGVTDDLIGVSYKAKFVAQIICALLFPLSGLWIHDLSGLFWLHEIPAWIGMPLTVFVVVYVTNAINLIDGVDGLASGLCSISLFTLGMASAIKGQYLFSMISFAMLGVLIPFWFYNVFGNAEKGKKIFMGDTGSLTLGYLLSFLLVYMASLDKMGFPRGMLLMGFSTMIIPLMDIPRVMFVRMRERRNPFTPDKNHIHHKLMRTGMSPKWTMVTLLLISAALIGFTVGGVMLDINKTLILILDIIFGVLLHLIIDKFIKE